MKLNWLDGIPIGFMVPTKRRQLALWGALLLVKSRSSTCTEVLCSETGSDCMFSKCCKDPSVNKCYEKDATTAVCKPSCTKGFDPNDVEGARSPWTCDVLKPTQGPWRPGLGASHFWDCNGAGCDATTLSPFVKSRFIYSAQYAPTDPHDHGGPAYGEHLWLTGAASDTLAAAMGADAVCCGSDEDSGGCGRCLLVRNPSAVNKDWKAVIMKKSRCPPESRGCEVGHVHMDIAVPGYDSLAESTANVCGSGLRENTFLTRNQSAVCGKWWEAKRESTVGSCKCSLLPNATAEQRTLRRGCELFTAWGWTTGTPKLEYYPVQCPRGFQKLVSNAFSSSGVAPMKGPSLMGIIVVACVVLVVCSIAGVINWCLRLKKNRKLEEEARLKRINSKVSKWKNNPNLVAEAAA